MFYKCYPTPKNGLHLTEPLPCSGRADKSTQTNEWNLESKAVWTGSGAMLRIQSFRMIRSGIQNFIGGGGGSERQKQDGNIMSFPA
jgi:hypothetical protein